MMSESKNEPAVKLGYDNWYLWDRYFTSTILRKNAEIALEPEPVNPSAQQQTTAPATTGTSGTPSVTVTTQPTAEELKTYRDELKEWKTVNNIARGIIIGTISDEIQHVIDRKEPAKVMYNKLEAAVAIIYRIFSPISRRTSDRLRRTPAHLRASTTSPTRLLPLPMTIRHCAAIAPLAPTLANRLSGSRRTTEARTMDARGHGPYARFECII